MTERKERETVRGDRREFFRTVALAGGALGAAVVSGGAGVAVERERDRKATGYRETAHVRRYYDLARF